MRSNMPKSLCCIEISIAAAKGIAQELLRSSNKLVFASEILPPIT